MFKHPPVITSGSILGKDDGFEEFSAIFSDSLSLRHKEAPGVSGPMRHKASKRTKPYEIDNRNKPAPKKKEKERDVQTDICDLRQSQSIECVASVRPGGYTISDIAFCKDDEFIAGSAVTGRVLVYDVSQMEKDGVDDDIEGDPVASLGTDVHHKLSSLRWSPFTKESIVCGDYDGGVSLFNAQTGTLVRRHAAHDKRVWSVDFNNVNGRLYYSGGDDYKVKMYDINSPACVGTFDGQGRNVCSVRAHPSNENYLAVGCADHRAYIMDTRTRKSVATFSGHKKSIAHTAFVSDDLILTAGVDSVVKLWSISRQECIKSYLGHINARNFVGLGVDHTRQYFAVGSETNEFFLFHVDHTMRVLRSTFPVTEGRPRLHISGVAWMHKQPTLAVCNSRGHIRVYRHASEW